MSASEPAVVTGVVEDADGNPVEGVTCILKRQSDNTVFETTTDVSGVYRFENLPQGEYHGMVRWEDGQGNLYNSRNQPYIQVAGPDIPEQGSLHARYDATSLSLSDGGNVSTWEDETGNGHDLTAGSAATYASSSINGNPTVQFDGSGEYLQTSFSELSQPNHIFAVLRWNTNKTGGDNAVAWDAASGEQRLQDNGEGNDIIFAGNILNASTIDLDSHVYGTLYNGANSEIRKDGAVDVTGDAGADGLQGFTLGARSDQAAFANIEFGEILIYPSDKTGVASEAEAYLSGKWGVPIS